MFEIQFELRRNTLRIQKLVGEKIISETYAKLYLPQLRDFGNKNTHLHSFAISVFLTGPVNFTDSHKRPVQPTPDAK